MHCLECGGTYKERTGTYSLVDPYVGDIILDGLLYYKCDKCGHILYSAAMAEEIDLQRSKRIHELLNRFPIGDFISASETASMLDISRQALHKNRRINHGFIYHIKSGPTTFYLKQSVQKYKESGDGRFPLQSARYTPSTAYAKSAFPFINLSSYEPSYGPYQILKRRIRPHTGQSFVRLKEYSHAN